MKLTLLEMVQDIMNDLDFDYVNGISDTPDALQVATIIRTTYFELLTSRTWPHTRKLATLQPSNDIDLPNYLRVPESLYELHWIKYNSKKEFEDRDRWRDINLVDPKEFLDRVMTRNHTDANVDVIADMGGTDLLIINNKAPDYVTTFDDEWLVFDSYDSAVDDTLQASKCQAMIVEEPVFTIADNFVPDMPAKAFPYLLAEAKSVCFATLKQLPNQKEEQRSRRQRTTLARGKYRIGNYVLNKPVDFGRR